MNNFNYWLFGFMHYYPEGGFSDFKGAYKDLELAVSDAEELLNEKGCLYTVQVVEVSTLEVVFTRSDNG